jgi:hypothetical protein
VKPDRNSGYDEMKELTTMTVNLKLPPDIQQAFLAEAAAKGISFDDLVRDVLLLHQPQTPVVELSPEEWVRQFKAWAASHAADDFPLLSDEAISRDTIYAHRGL